MKKLLRKIPLILWAVLMSATAFMIVQQNRFAILTKDQISLFSGFLTFIGLVFVAINIQKQWKNERIKTEYLNQPDFSLRGFDNEEFEGSGPTLCPNPTECTADHWLDLIQIGNLAARDLKVALFTSVEAKSSVRNSDRWLHEERLGKNDDFQYKLPQFEIPFNYFDKNNRMCFFLLLEYRSEYSGIKYKRVYQLCSSAYEDPKSTKENDWKDQIYFYASSLIMTTDTDSISIKDILFNKWLKFARWSHLRKDYPYEDWLIDI